MQWGYRRQEITGLCCLALNGIYRKDAECAEKGRTGPVIDLTLSRAGAQQAAPLPRFLVLAAPRGEVGLVYLLKIERPERLW